MVYVALQVLLCLAKNQQTDEIASIEQLKQFAEQIEKEISKFNQALLLLSSPNGIGLSTQEDIHISADRQINNFAADSINLSTQNNLIAHAQNRISMFAAQNGIKQVAAKGKFEAHAQSEGMGLLAKQGIQIISTEDRIYITAAKKIILTGGSSQIEIGSNILSKTGGLFESKAGQHKFEGGENIVSPKINLPMVKTLFSNQVNYNWNIKSQGEKEIFIINQKSNDLIKTQTDQLDHDNNMSSLRFYTSQAMDFTALIFNSDIPRLKQDVPDSENIDELLEEALQEEGDEVYTEEDSNE